MLKGLSRSKEVTWVSVLGPGQVNLAAIKVDFGPLETLLLARTDTGMDREKQVGMNTGISRPEQSSFLLVEEKPYFVVVFRFPFKGGKPASRLSMLSILCHFHGLLWKRVSQNHNHRKPFWERESPVRAADYPASALRSMLDERIGDFA